MSANQAILLRRLNFVNNFPAEIWYCWGRLHKKKIQWQCSVSYPFSAVAIDPFNFIRAQKLPSKGVPSSPLLWSANIRPTQQKIFTCWKKTDEIFTTVHFLVLSSPIWRTTQAQHPMTYWCTYMISNHKYQLDFIQRLWKVQIQTSKKRQNVEGFCFSALKNCLRTN